MLRPSFRAPEFAHAEGGGAGPRPSKLRDDACVALGRVVRELRKHEGVSQEELASRAGVHRTHIGGIERGEGNPSYTNLRAIAAALGVQASELVLRAESLVP